ncbi:hypothetical protein QQ045_022673 [Rhodiola kirilowii]
MAVYCTTNNTLIKSIVLNATSHDIQPVKVEVRFQTKLSATFQLLPDYNAFTCHLT